MKINWNAPSLRRAIASFFTVLLFFVGIGFYQLGNTVFAPKDLGEGRLLTLSKEFLLATQGGDVSIEPPAPVIPKFPEKKVDAVDVDPSAFSAEAILVKDTETGAVLFGKNEYAQRSIASITKLMSALVLIEHGLDWTATTTVVEDALIDTHMYAGDTYTIRELWLAALVGSSNKAIMTLADYVGWNREAFVARMNERARELGMGQTTFVEPTGLEAGNTSTPSDIAILLNEALKHDDLKQAVLERELTLYSEEREKEHHLWSTNWLLLGWIPNTFANIEGGKTGYIDASGYNFTVRVKNEAGHIIDVIILGAKTHEGRFSEARDIANWAFDNYVWPEEPPQT